MNSETKSSKQSTETKANKHSDKTGESSKWEEFAAQHSTVSDSTSTQDISLDAEDNPTVTDTTAASEDQASLLDDALESAGLKEPSHEALENQLLAVERQVQEYKTLAMKAQAELSNVQRRADNRIADAHKFGNERLIKDLLPVVDSLLRGLENADAEHGKGLQLILDMLESILSKHSVTEINPVVGEKFDPARHEAMSMQTQAQAQSNTVLQVLQKGYALNERVLRAAMVIVAA